MSISTWASASPSSLSRRQKGWYVGSSGNKTIGRSQVNQQIQQRVDLNGQLKPLDMQPCKSYLVDPPGM